MFIEIKTCMHLKTDNTYVLYKNKSNLCNNSYLCCINVRCTRFHTFSCSMRRTAAREAIIGPLSAWLRDLEMYHGYVVPGVSSRDPITFHRNVVPKVSSTNPITFHRNAVLDVPSTDNIWCTRFHSFPYLVRHAAARETIVGPLSMIRRWKIKREYSTREFKYTITSSTQEQTQLPWEPVAK